MTKRKAGRPTEGAEVKKRYNVVLEPPVAERLRDYGKNNLSRGIALAAEKLKLSRSQS
jgi:hypothetical protein